MKKYQVVIYGKDGHLVSFKNGFENVEDAFVYANEFPLSIPQEGIVIDVCKYEVVDTTEYYLPHLSDDDFNNLGDFYFDD